MNDYAKPNMNPADDGTLRGMMNVAFESLLKNLDNMLPAQVISFDRNTNKAVVKPMIRIIKTDGNTISRTNINNIPVFQPSGRGFVINFPLKAGDLGWIHASDRDISTFMQNLKESQPNTLRKHTFENGVFYPDVMRGWAIDSENSAALVIQTLDGNQCISIHDNKIKLKGTLLELDFDNITGVGDTAFTGNLTVSGEVRTELSGGVNLSDHYHTNVESGPSNTGGPVS